MAFIHCPHCGREVSELAHKCPGCGTSLDAYKENVVFCKYCGMEILPDEIHGETAFCVSCRRSQKIEITPLASLRLQSEEKKHILIPVYEPEQQSTPISDFIESDETEPITTSHSNWKWFLAIAIFLGFLAYTKPNKAQHAEKLKEVALDYMASKDKNDLDRGLTVLFGPFVADRVVETHLQVDDFFFFSVGRIKWENQNYPATIGVFNNVFLVVNPDRVF